MSDLNTDHNPSQWVDAYGDSLYRFALSRLHDHSSAEDAVQETFLSALRSHAKYKGEASELTWLIGILKHKVVDIIRKESRMVATEEIVPPNEDTDEVFFDRKGRWRVGISAWKVHPSQLIERKEFRSVLQRCLAHLPLRMRRIFTLREMEDKNSEEICKLLDITPTNLWVMLHRSRIKLRGCINDNWFSKDEEHHSSC